VQLVIVGDLFIGVQVEPALTTLRFRPRVPGDA